MTYSRNMDFAAKIETDGSALNDMESMNTILVYHQLTQQTVILIFTRIALLRASFPVGISWLRTGVGRLWNYIIKLLQCFLIANEANHQISSYNDCSVSNTMPLSILGSFS